MIDKFINEVCREFNMTRETLAGENRQRDIVDLRFACYHVINLNNPGISRRAIGSYFGKKHSSVYHGIREAGVLISTIPYFRETVGKLDDLYKTMLAIRRKSTDECRKMPGKNEFGMRVYIAGKITGTDYEQTVEKFNSAEKRLSGKGYEVMNPIKISPFSPAKEWQDYMSECIPALMTSDSIYLLPDWGQSRGARIEYAIAREMGLEIIFQNP